MIYAEIKNQAEQEHLSDALKASKDRNWYCRLKIIDLSSKKTKVGELSQEFDLSDATIRRYIHAYNSGGLSKLKPGKSPGRPPKIGHWTKEQWDKVLEQTPNQYDELNTQSRQWTLDGLRLYVKEYHGIQVSISSVHRSLRKTGRRTGRSKLRVGSPDPGYVVKRKYVEELRNFL